MSETEEIVVAQFIGWDSLTKILLAYLKAGGDKDKVALQDVQQISNVSQNNVSINNKFFVSMGLLEEGEGRSYKLTDSGAKYTKALDWGRINEAKTILAQTISDRPLVKRTLSYVELNKPVTKEDLVGKIANIASVTKEQRFATGIRGFVDMLTASGLLQEDVEGKITVGKKETLEAEMQPEKKTQTLPALLESGKKAVVALPVNITISVDANTDIVKIKAIVRAIREALTES